MNSKSGTWCGRAAYYCSFLTPWVVYHWHLFTAVPFIMRLRDELLLLKWLTSISCLHTCNCVLQLGKDSLSSLVGEVFQRLEQFSLELYFLVLRECSSRPFCFFPVCRLCHHLWLSDVAGYLPSASPSAIGHLLKVPSTAWLCFSESGHCLCLVLITLGFLATDRKFFYSLLSGLNCKFLV